MHKRLNCVYLVLFNFSGGSGEWGCPALLHERFEMTFLIVSPWMARFLPESRVVSVGDSARFVAGGSSTAACV